MSKCTYHVYIDGKVVSRFDEEILALNYIRNQAPDHKDADFAIEKIERIFDTFRNSTDKARLVRFRNSKADNSVHAGIRNSDLDIGREDLD
jgi:hypothetical protein